MLKWRIVILVAIAFVGAACSDTTETTTTTGASSTDDIVFGQGEMPDSVPDSFPLPQGSAVGSTMVIKDGLTEVVIRVNADVGITAEYFAQGLEQGGFTIDLSEQTDDGWTIEFNYEGTKGTLDISAPQGGGISQAVLRYNVP